jgi:signal transduction histidine kinase/CheY-like chemotaxis protein
MAKEKKIKEPWKYMTVQLRIFIVVIFAAIFIVFSALGTGILFLTNNIKDSMFDEIITGIMLIGVIIIILSVIAAVITVYFLNRPFVEADTLRKEAETASISKSVFLSNISHEIMTPMSSIIGFSELAMDENISVKTKDYLKEIHTNAEWLLQMINNILDISKIEAGRMKLEKIPFDIHELFSSIRTLIMPRAVEKGIMLHFFSEPSIGKMTLGDPARLRQVFVNLLANAIKFTNFGIVKLLIDIVNIKDKTITMNFEVRDSGIGMTEEQIKKIFDPSVQAQAGITRKFGGTGLGLNITKNIIEMMGGKLHVESAPGAGSKFSFELTFELINVNESERPKENLLLNEIEKPFFEGEVLLCEDNEMNQKVVGGHLDKVNLKTFMAENGKIGLEMVKKRMINGEKQFDLILMDIQMPVMDGLEATTEIVKLKTNIPIIAMTANVTARDREIYKMIGMNDCIGKPFTSQELWYYLLKYLVPVSAEKANEGALLENNMEFQKSIEKMFVENNSENFKEITEALNKNDIELAYRLAHTLKSNAGHIGKTLLQQAAGNIELQLKDGKNLVSGEQLEILEKEMKNVLNEFSALADDSEDKSGETKITFLGSDKTRELLEKLKPMIEMCNPESLKFMDDLRGVSGGDLLIQQLQDYDFEAASLTLEELLLK